MDTEDEWMNKLPTWVVVLVGIAFVSFGFWVVVGGYQQRHARSANPRYTIGYVTGTGYAISSSSQSVSFFRYTVGDSTYRTSSSGGLTTGCTRYLVKYAVDDPQNFEFFNHICVPDSITEAPEQGWQKPPFSVPNSVK